MLDIRRTKLTYAEARRISRGAISGININILLEDVLVRGQDIEITFKYTVNYADKIGSLIMRGLMTATGELAECQQVSKEWTDRRRLPKEFAEDVLNTINYACGTNGTLVVRAINLSPPMVPPRILVTAEGASGSQKEAAPDNQDEGESGSQKA
ncbi:MAG: hypothetical protein KAT35_04320 [Candidatus Aenigmarchaeota archaeon]|nr:hypothetical protein [Candidatus Aenigmarchaeota archaeon]